MPNIQCITCSFFLLLAIQTACSESFVKSLENWRLVGEFEAEINVTGTAGFAPDEQFQMEVLMRQSSNENKFYRHTKITRFGQISFDTVTSYDESVYSCLDKSGVSSLLTTSKNLPERVPNFLISFFPFDIFRFMAQKAQNQFIGIPDLLAVSASGPLLASSHSLVDESFLGRKAFCIIIPTKGGKGNYKVYFSDDKLSQLLGWQHFLADGSLFSQLKIGDWDQVPVQGASRSVFYPRHYDWTFFKSGSSANPEIAFSYSAEIKAINLFSSEGSLDFTIDPSVADYIDDRDNDILIKVPR